VSLGNRPQPSDHVRIIDPAIRTRTLGQCESQPQNQMFVFVEKLVADFDLRKQRRLVQIPQLARLFVLPRLL
jgi:hypothetical protein